jgi:hypothetical protein
LVATENLWKPSVILRYAREKASQEVRTWLVRYQEKLPTLLLQARQFQDAPLDAERDSQTEWGLVQHLAGQTCPCSGNGPCLWDSCRGFLREE